jgi:hypothetical protein
MARRRSRRSTVRGKPNYMWINTAGDLATIEGNTVWDGILVPQDWSGTVTETQCTLLRLVLSVYTYTTTESGYPHAQNMAIVLGSASEGAGTDTLDVSLTADWPDFFISYDRVLRIGRLEWDGVIKQLQTGLLVQFSQLPEPIMNLKTPRHLRGDDSVRLCVGGNFSQVASEVYAIMWFARSLVRLGLR